MDGVSEEGLDLGGIPHEERTIYARGPLRISFQCGNQARERQNNCADARGKIRQEIGQIGLGRSRKARGVYVFLLLGCGK